MGFPNAFLPTLLTEGFAVKEETTLTPYGRGNGPFSSTFLKNLEEEGGIPPMGSTILFRRVFPGGDSPYLLGGSFHLFLEEKYPGSLKNLYRINSTGLFPFLPCIPFCLTYEKLPEDLWREFRWYLSQKENSSSPSPTPLAGPFWELRNLRFHKGKLYGTVEDGIHHPSIGYFDPTGRYHPLIDREGGRGLAIGEEGIVYDQFHYEKDTVITLKPFLYTGKETFLLKELPAPLWEIDIFRKKWVGVTRKNGRFCLLYGELPSTLSKQKGKEKKVPAQGKGTYQTVFCAPVGEFLYDPRLNPQGTSFVFTWKGEGERIYLYSEGKVTPLLPWGKTFSPRFSRDGKWVFFLSTIEGKPGIYALEITTGTPYKIYLPSTGVFSFEIVEEENRLYYTAPKKGGYYLYTLPIPEKTFFQPQSAEKTTFPTSPTLSPSPLPPTYPYTPLPSLLPSSFQPILGIAPSFHLFGGGFSSEDPVGNYRYTLTLISYNLFRKGEDPLFGGDLSFQWDQGQFLLPLETRFFPSFREGKFHPSYEIFFQMGGVRVFRKVHDFTTLSLQGSLLRLPEEKEWLPEGTMRFRKDRRYSTPLLLDPTSDLFSIEGGIQKGGVRGEIRYLHTIVLFKKIQGKGIVLSAFQPPSEKPFRFTLLPPEGVPLSPREYSLRAVPLQGVTEVIQFVGGETELVIPILYPDLGCFTVPIYWDSLHLRPFLSALKYEKRKTPATLYGYGVEMGVDLFLSERLFFPIRVGVRKIYPSRETIFYLTLTTSEKRVFPSASP
jgi:hypothetical protein